jgi:hypothetical protein
LCGSIDGLPMTSTAFCEHNRLSRTDRFFDWRINPYLSQEMFDYNVTSEGS